VVAELPVNGRLYGAMRREVLVPFHRNIGLPEERCYGYDIIVAVMSLHSPSGPLRCFLSYSVGQKNWTFLRVDSNPLARISADQCLKFCDQFFS